MQKSNALVNFETNKFIHGSYHHKKYQEYYNLDSFLRLIKNSEFKEHKEFDEIREFFQPSIEIIAKEILDDLNENGLKRKESRLKLFLNDLINIIKFYQNIVKDIDFENLILLYKSARKNIMSPTNNDLSLAVADIKNLLQEYQLLEKKIIKKLLHNMALLVEKNYKFFLGHILYEDDDTPYRRNIIEERLSQYIDLLYIILMNKDITKKEIINLFKKLCSKTGDYTYLGCYNKTYFMSDYPIEIDKPNYTRSENNYRTMQYVESLSIQDRFNRFFELLYEEKECFYIFKIFNSKIYKTNEIKLCGVTYYNEKIQKSKGSKYTNKYAKITMDDFGEEKEVKALIPYKTKRYFPNISALKVRSIIENNISILKLYQRPSTDNTEYFTQNSIKMDVSYSYIMLDKNYYFLSNSFTHLDWKHSYDKNTLTDKIFTNEDLNNKLNTFIKHLNYKQTESVLTTNDYLILQSLQKYKLASESTSFSDLLLITWSGLELIAGSIDRDKKLELIQKLVSIVYSFLYTNKWFYYDLSKKESKKMIDHRAKHLVIYAYTYRNKIVHSHLIENSFMISISRGINIIFRELLILILDKIILSSDFELKSIIAQLESDLNSRIEKIKNEANNKNKG